MPVSWAVDQALEDWYRSKMLIRKWPLENHLLHAARFCNMLVQRCELSLRLMSGNGGAGFACDAGPSAETLTLSIPDGIERSLKQTVVETAFELVISGGRVGFNIDEAIEIVLHQVHESLYATAVRYAREGNARKCRSMPPEVLCAILVHAPFRDRLAATQVCSSWRAAARSAPRLWCDLELFARRRSVWDHECWADFKTDRIVIQQFLALSKRLPLSLAMHDLRPWHVDVLHAPLGEHVSRLRQLELRVAADTGQKTAMAMMHVLSKKAAPLLERFVLTAPRSSGNSIPLNCRIFEGTAPRLTEVVLLSCTLGDSRHWAAGAFANVLSLSTPYTAGAAIARATQHLHLLRVFPKLTELTLWAVQAGAMLPFIDPDTTLRKLTLEVPPWASPDALTEMLDPPHGKRAPARMRDHDHVRELEMVFADIASGAALRAATRELPHWTHVGVLSDGAARVRLSVWCGPDRVRHVVFRRPDAELLKIVCDGTLFAGAYVDVGWETQLARCRQELLGVAMLSAMRAQFSRLLVAHRPSLLA